MNLPPRFWLAVALCLAPLSAAAQGLVDPKLDSSKAKAAAAKARAEREAERFRGVPKAGHGRQGWYDYDIWKHNCHTAANTFLCFTPDKARAGIVACGGDPTVDPAHHTFNWIVLEKETCLYNWGQPCCWPSTQIPPDITKGGGLHCAKVGCGNQYCKDTKCLPPGKNVERPNPSICALISEGGTPDGPIPPHPTMSKEKLPECASCCDSRANMWKWSAATSSEPQLLFDAERENFRDRCKKFCRSIFTD